MFDMYRTIYMIYYVNVVSWDLGYVLPEHRPWNKEATNRYNSYHSHFRSPESNKISALDTMLMGSLDLAFPWPRQIQVYKTLQNLTTAVGAAYEANSMFFSSSTWWAGMPRRCESTSGLHSHTYWHIGVILPRLISVESYRFRWWFLVLVLGPRRLVQHVTKSRKQLSNSKTRYAFWKVQASWGFAPRHFWVQKQANATSSRAHEAHRDS